METRLIRLQFSEPVHFGTGRLSESSFTFDAATLFSALFIEALNEGEDQNLLKAARSGELLVSDAFPVVGSVFYVPKPASSLNVRGQNIETGMDATADVRAKKAYKQLDYLPVQCIHDYLQGTLDPVAVLNDFKLGRSGTQVRVNMQGEPYEDPRPYTVGGFTFAPDAGLYVIVQGSYPVELLFEQLQYAGIGGKRTSGYGRFICSVLNFNSLQGIKLGSVPAQRAHNMLLSSAVPGQDEWTNDLLRGARYRLAKRGGFVQSTNGFSAGKRRDMYVFRAGSLFAKPFAGDVFDVSTGAEGHPVYRYARALWMEV